MIARSIENNKFLSSAIYQELREQVPLLHKETREIDKHIITVFDSGKGAINEAVRIFNEVSSLAKRQPDDKISCFLYLLDFPKQLDLSKSNITTAECNTATTTFYSLENKIEIALWRKEEWQKVFYHELIHAFSIDTIISPMKEQEQQIKRMFLHYNNTIREAYTEILATRLASKENLKDEALFIGAQVNKLIYFMEHNEPIIETKSSNLNNRSGIEHIDAFFNNPSRLLDSTTNTSSYYVLKSIYYWYAVTHDPSILEINKLTDKQFVRHNFYRILLEALETGEYQTWLKDIYFTPSNLSLRLTYRCL